MESFAGDGEGSADDLTGGKSKSKLKTLKTRLFGRTKRETKQSQSTSDVTEVEGLGSAEHLCSGVLGSRALSHDSIFLADQDLSSPEQPRVLSQENVQGRIKELQMKLQQQNMRLGPSPMVLPIKRPEDLGGSSEDDGLPHSPPEISMGNNRHPLGASCKASPQPLSCPLSPVPKPLLTSFLPLTPSAPLSAFSPASPALDFSTPAQFTPSLDNSAARHRMSIKPRNQRASTKNKRLTMTESRPLSESLNNFHRPLIEEEEDRPAITGEKTRLHSHSTQTLKAEQGGSNTPTAPPELTPLKGFPKTSTPTLPCKPSPQEQPHPGVALRPVETVPGKQPQSSSVTTVQDLRYTPQQQTLKQSHGDPKPSAPSQTKRDVLSKSGVKDSTPSTEGIPKENSVPAAQPAASLASVVALRTSSLRLKPEAGAAGQSSRTQEDPGQSEPLSMGGAPRSVSGSVSGSFRFSINSAREQERPRTGSGGFLGVVEQAGAGVKREGREKGTEVRFTPSNASQRGQDQQGGRQEGAKPKEEDLTDSDMVEKVSEGEEVEEESREGVEEAVEVKEGAQEEEEEGKSAFGVKLRSTYLSLRVRAEAATSQSDLKIKRQSQEVGALPLTTYTPSSKPTGLEGLQDTLPTNSMPKKLHTNTWYAPTTLSSPRGRAGSLREAATSAQPTLSPLTKEAQTTPATAKEVQTTPVPAMEAHTTSSAPQDPPTGPQAAPQATVSWMSMAWGKTRGLQQLFTSSLPKDFTGMQSPTQPQRQTTTQSQTSSLAQIVTQTQRQNATQTQTAPPQAQTTAQLQQTTMQPPLTAKLLQSQNSAQLPQTAAQAHTQTKKQQQTAKTPQTQNATQPQTATHPSTQAAQPTTTPQPLSQSTLSSVSRVTSQSNLQATQHTLRFTSQTQATLRSAPMGATSTQLPAQSSLSSSPSSTPSQPPRCAQVLNPTPPPKPALAPTTTPAPVQAAVPALGRGERTPVLQGKSEEAAVPTEKRVDRDRPEAVGRRAAFLEKRAEWTPPAGSKVELRRTRTPPESQPTAESAAPSKTPPTHRDTKVAKLDGRPESSPTKVAGRLADREDKWLRKNMATSSSSLLSSSPLRTISDSGGQPSWMELAKRKSMAWNDKTTDG